MRPYIRSANIRWTGLDLSDVKQMNFTEAESQTYELKPGDVLVAEASGSASEVGKPAVWRGEIPECCFQNTVIRVRPHTALPEYLRYWFLAEARSGRIGAAAPGVGIHHIGSSRLAAWRVPIPPLNEQWRIVTALDEHFSRLDAGDASIATGLKRLETVRKATIVESIPIPGPSHWRTVTVSDAGEVELGRQRSPKFHSGANMRPYLKVANVFEDRLDLSDVMEMDFPPSDHAKYRLKYGDILLNEGQTPQLVGRPAMYRDELDDVGFTNSLIRFRPGDGVDGEFALLVFRRHLHAGRFQREAQITTNIAHLSAGRFKTVEFPVPPLNEQREIVTRVDSRLSAVTALRTQLERAQRRSGALRQSILDRAFRGELVSRDPSDDRVATRTQPESLAQSRLRKAGA